MALPDILEGTGEELLRHLALHSKERFRLVPLGAGGALTGRTKPAGPSHISLEAEERILDELAALGANLAPSSRDETYSRETIYAEHE